MNTFTTKARSVIAVEAPTTRVLSRKLRETILIGDEVEVTVVAIQDDKVRLAIAAPRAVPVHRREVYEAIQRKSRAAEGMRGEVMGVIADGEGET